MRQCLLRRQPLGCMRSRPRLLRHGSLASPAMHTLAHSRPGEAAL